MLIPSNHVVELFYSYSHKDEQLRKKLENHLAGLRRNGIIKSWHDRKISAGEEWKDQIDDHINTADIILLLVSADFLASDYCYEKELNRAMERHQSGEARVIPVILRPCDWRESPFGKLQALPEDGKPVTTWSDLDEALLNVAQGIRQTVEQLREGQRGELSNELDERPRDFLRRRVLESHRFFLEYQRTAAGSDDLARSLVEKHRLVIAYYVAMYLSLCRRQSSPPDNEVLAIAKEFEGTTSHLTAITSGDVSDLFTSLAGSRIIRVATSQMFRIADLLTRPESVKAKNLYEAITNSGKMRRALNRRQPIHIGELGDLKPVMTGTEVYDRFWRPALPDFRLITSRPLCFFPYELSLSPRVQNLRSKFDSVLKAALPTGSASIVNSQISGRLRIYPPGTGVIHLRITLEFREAIHIETVAQIARNIEELVFVDPVGLEQPYHSLMLEIVEQVTKSLFKSEAIPAEERRWLPPTTTLILQDHGLMPEAEIEKLAYLLSLAPANQEDLRYLERRVAKAIQLPQWQRDRILAVVGQGVGLFFVADLFAKGSQNKREHLQEWLAETHELVSAAAYAQLAFAEEVERLYSQRLLNQTWLESDEKFNYLLSLLETMKQVMQAIVSIKLHLQRQGAGVLMTLAKDIWAYSNPVDSTKFQDGLAYIASWLARSQAKTSSERIMLLQEPLTDIREIKPPFSISRDYSSQQPASSLQEILERRLLHELQEIEQIFRGGKAPDLEQIPERFQVISQLRKQLGF